MPSIDRQIGISGGWIAGPSAGLAMMAAPEYLHLHPIATAVCFWVGIIVFIISVGHVFYVQWQERGKRLSGPALVMCCGIVVFLAGFAWWFWPNEAVVSSDESVSAKTESAKDDPSRPSLLDLFMTDFTKKEINTQVAYPKEFVFKDTHHERFYVLRNYGLESHSYTLSFFITTQGWEKIIKYIAKNNKRISVETIPSVFDVKIEGNSSIEKLEEITFNGRIFIYVPTIFDAEVIGDLSKLCRENGCSLQMRGNEYEEMMKQNIRKYKTVVPSHYEIINGQPRKVTDEIVLKY